MPASHYYADTEAGRQSKGGVKFETDCCEGKVAPEQEQHGFSAEQRAFQQHSNDLRMAIDAPEELTWTLFSKDIVTDSVISKVSVRELTTEEKNGILLVELKERIRDAPAFDTLVQVLQSSEEGILTDIGSRLKETRGNVL